MPRQSRNMLLLFLTILAGGAGLFPGAAAPYPVKMESRLRLQIRPMMIHGEETAPLENRTVVLSPRDGGVLRFHSGSSDAGDGAQVTLQFHGAPSHKGETQQVHMDSKVVFPGRNPVEQSRDLHLEEHSVRLVEIYAREEIRLTLALEIDTVHIPVVQQPSGKDHPVEFRLRVARLSEGTSTPLETDTLKTFLGTPVSYSFRRGSGASLETIHLEMIPVTVEGDLLQVRVSLAGEIRTGATPLFLNRSQTVVTGRDSPTEFQATTGDPPEGYSFTVTPRF